VCEVCCVDISHISYCYWLDSPFFAGIDKEGIDKPMAAARNNVVEFGAKSNVHIKYCTVSSWGRVLETTGNLKGN
jgi:hypothetical protein